MREIIKLIENVNNVIKNNKVLLLIFVTALFLRTVYLDTFPVAITHDEHEYIMNARSLFYTGENIPFTPLGFLLGSSTEYDQAIAEIPSYILAPLIGPFPESQFLARLPFAIVSSFTVVLIYLIVFTLTNKKSLSLIAALILAFNPWSIHFGRTAFEFNFALFFYLIGIYFLIIFNNWKILYSMLFFILGFLSYHGAKVLFFPLIFILVLFKFFSGNEIKRKPLLILLGLAFCVVILYSLNLKFQPTGSRVSELFPNQQESASYIDQERGLSIYGFQQQIFINKLTYPFTRVVDTYLHSFSTDFLFINGEVRGAYSFWKHGLFYYIDFILILVGLIGLYIISKKAAFLIFAIILVSPVPSALNFSDQSYVIRSSLMFPFLCVLSGTGIWFLISNLKYMKKTIASLLIVIYIISIANFLNLYFTRYPVYASEGFFLSNKTLSRYIDLSLDNTSGKIIISTTEPRIIFEKFLFYNNLYTGYDQIQEINNDIKNKKYMFENVEFIDKCLENKNSENIVWIYESKLNCLNNSQEVSKISSPADGGSQWVINNDILCRDYLKNSYPKVRGLFDFNIYEMNKKDFCEKWISVEN